MASHTVLIGFGDTGRITADVLSRERSTPRLVVVDLAPARLLPAVERGATAVVGDGADLDTLRLANVGDAARVIVAVADDMVAVRIVAAVRSVNNATTIITLLRESRWRDMAESLGADQVVVVEHIVGRLLGLSVRRPAQTTDVRQAPPEALDLAVTERAVRDPEVGRAPSDCGPLVLAVVRGSTRVWLDDPSVESLRPSDRLLVLHASTRDD
ncbi:potassium channel family protein [Saccharothrix deserti]|uniref:potassium channel family protein n=1 Tax=Saccharothrix deserti TaxID=2593674 RepID=UPI00131B7E36|nr:NAD(P)-binding protein [Saccharothrix deserti]